MVTFPTDESPPFRRIVDVLTSPAAISALSDRTGVAVERVRWVVETAIAESAQTLAVLAGVDGAPEGPLLEVGAGLGFTCIVLAESGFDITGIEPGGQGFEDSREIARAAREMLGAPSVVCETTIEQFDAGGRRFAVVFSNNVLEHVDDVRVAVASMSRLLDTHGVMVHSCPNYRVPFEAHFNVPLVPFRPAWTARLLPRSISGSGLWKSLNFVTDRQIVSAAAAVGLEVRFRSGRLAASFERLDHDDAFASRHPVLARVAPIARRTGLIALLRRLPATWGTPMDFLVTRAEGHSSPERPDSPARSITEPPRWAQPSR